MFKEQIVSLVLVVFLSNFVEVSNANKRSGCPYGWSYFYYTKLCYKRFSTSSRVSWMNAQNTCRRNGGDLAIIRNSATNNFVYQCSKGARIWIGAIRSGQTPNYSSQFTWVDGSIPLYYSNFQNADNANGVEGCVMMNLVNNGKWNDYDCWSSSNAGVQIKNFVCQRASY